MNYKSIVILTGAGISAESGIPTFRASDGLWCQQRIADVATPEGFERNPSLVHEFYNVRRAQLQEIAPNPAHHALVELAAKWEGNVTIITQNVDDLHDRATQDRSIKTNYRLIPMHGELKKARCMLSDEVFAWEDDLTTTTHCPCCNVPEQLRPHIVWFGEMPLYMGLIDIALKRCDLFISIGTSGSVYPASDFVHTVRSLGRAHTVEINLEPSLDHSLFHERIYGKATEKVPEYVQRILAGEVLDAENYWFDEEDEEDEEAIFEG